MIRPAEPPSSDGADGVTAGLRFVARSPIIRASLTGVAVINFFNMMFSALFMLYAVRELHVRPGVLGVVIGAGAVGGMIASLTAKRLGNRLGIGLVYVVGCFVFTLPLALVPLAASVHGVAVLLMLFAAEFTSGFGVMALDISIAAIFAMVIPDTMRSRVAGAFQAINYGTRPAGALIGGALGASAGLRPALWVAVAGGVAGALLLLPSPLPGFRLPFEGKPRLRVPDPATGAQVPRTARFRRGGARRIAAVTAGLAVLFGFVGALADHVGLPVHVGLPSHIASPGTVIEAAGLAAAILVAVAAMLVAVRTALSKPSNVEAMADRTERATRLGNSNERASDSGGDLSPDMDGQPYDNGPPPPRFLVGILPERVPSETHISLLVQITLAIAQRRSTTLDAFPWGEPGAMVKITVSAPALTQLGDSEQHLCMPHDADSRPVRFGFIAGAEGHHLVNVQALLGGTCLGELTLQISVEPEAPLEEGRTRTAPMAALAT